MSTKIRFQWKIILHVWPNIDVNSLDLLWVNSKTTTTGNGGVIVTGKLGKVVLNWSQHHGNVFTDMQVTVHIVISLF